MKEKQSSYSTWVIRLTKAHLQEARNKGSANPFTPIGLREWRLPIRSEFPEGTRLRRGSVAIVPDSSVVKNNTIGQVCLKQHPCVPDLFLYSFGSSSTTFFNDIICFDMVGQSDGASIIYIIERSISAFYTSNQTVGMIQVMWADILFEPRSTSLLLSAWLSNIGEGLSLRHSMSLCNVFSVMIIMLIMLGHCLLVRCHSVNHCFFLAIS